MTRKVGPGERGARNDTGKRERERKRATEGKRVRSGLNLYMYTGSRKYLNTYHGKLFMSILYVLYKTFLNFAISVIRRGCRDYIGQI